METKRVLTDEQREAKNARARARRAEAKQAPILTSPEQLVVQELPKQVTAPNGAVQHIQAPKETMAQAVARLTPWIVARFGRIRQAPKEEIKVFSSGPVKMPTKRKYINSGTSW